jgi:hypothetical protein
MALLLWAGFLFGFRSEPSATGRSRVVLLVYTFYTVLSALAGIGAAIGVLRGSGWSRIPAAVAAAAMTLTCLGAVAGVPVLLGVVPSLRSSSN